MPIKIIKNLDEMRDFANSFLENLQAKGDTAAVVALRGDLGSGKTAFVQAVAKVFGVQEYITSPTFVIQKKYKIHNLASGFENLIHIDAYRLGNEQELSQLDWEKTIANPKNIIFIEWAERVEEILPANTKKLFFKFIDEQTREIFCD